MAVEAAKSSIRSSEIEIYGYLLKEAASVYLWICLVLDLGGFPCYLNLFVILISWHAVFLS